MWIRKFVLNTLLSTQVHKTSLYHNFVASKSFPESMAPTSNEVKMFVPTVSVKT